MEHQFTYNAYNKIRTNFWPNHCFVLIHESIIHIVKQMVREKQGVSGMKKILQGLLLVLFVVMKHLCIIKMLNMGMNSRP